MEEGGRNSPPSVLFTLSLSTLFASKQVLNLFFPDSELNDLSGNQLFKLNAHRDFQAHKNIRRNRFLAIL